MRKSHRVTPSRANIPHPSVLCTSGGPRPPQFDPSFQVANQNEPTPAKPIGQHKQFKGHETSVSGGPRYRK